MECGRSEEDQRHEHLLRVPALPSSPRDWVDRLRRAPQHGWFILALVDSRMTFPSWHDTSLLQDIQNIANT